MKQASTVDYAVLEQRVLDTLHLPRLASTLLDIHTITTAIMLSIPYSQVTRPQRTRVGKTMNFSMLYTPGAMWEVPSEKALMAIWTESEKAQLCIDLGVTQPETLYQRLTTHFTTAYGGKQ